MKVIKVSEIIPELDESIKKKEAEKDQLQDVRASINNLINLDDALKGKGAEAIKEHLTVLHIPAVLLLNQFINEYVNRLKQVKNLISDYEIKSGLVRQDFVEHEAKSGIEKIEQMSEDTINDINQEFLKVSDIVGGSTISLAHLRQNFDKARRHIKKTTDGLEDLDKDSLKVLKESTEDLTRIADFINKIEAWASNGAALNESTIREIEKYFAENDTIGKLIDSAMELAIKEGDSTLMGNVADWLDKIGKLNGGMEIVKGTLAATILLTKRLVLVKDGSGNFKIKAHPDWLKKNGVYGSKLADSIHKILKNGSSSSYNGIKNYFSKYQNSPSRLLRSLVGLNPGSNVKSYLKLLEHQHPYLKFDAAQAELYKRTSIDVKSTLGQLTDKRSFTAIAKKIPYAGILFSVGTNAGEYISDKNKYKSNWEKTGRAAAGIGMDVGVAGLTTGGAAIGTMICPGPGTLIGGLVGATIGIAGSIAFEDSIKDIGEKAGKWAEEKSKDIKEAFSNVGEAISDAGSFVTGLFK
ncbi:MULTISPECIES: T7SS effector LXG polymorphic toxin [Cytobacillus]|uniref:T7SS effector LXG polymorphic toxin n=1 Tax=Cytobacillus TaxID=2675230 RepID=UPI002041DF22|nr:T7SS effector LXG polymorphic toxin [Cytobacillus firmus]MCM3705273.1 LXG domain-containing protein [Cytobacillus firmus]